MSHSRSKGADLSKRVLSLVAVCALASLVASGCSKSSSDQGATAQPSGPITDSGDTGLKSDTKPGQVAMGDPKHGGAIFTQNCSSCHGAAGAGGGIGPSLKGEKARKDYNAAITWIKNPQAPMPKLYPAPLSESDVSDVASYVETL